MMNPVKKEVCFSIRERINQIGTRLRLVHYLPSDSPFFQKGWVVSESAYLVQPFSPQGKGLSEFCRRQIISKWLLLKSR
jgi:hypothetical protein